MANNCLIINEGGDTVINQGGDNVVLPAIECHDRITVERMHVAANQPRILEVTHHIKVDDSEQLNAGDTVHYTDSDLGFCFAGRVIKKNKNYDQGEGVTYTCADAYRTLMKTPAFIKTGAGRTSKIIFPEGTPFRTAVDAVLSDLPHAYLPGGVDYSAVGNPSLPKIDKAGQTIDTWLEDFMKTISGAIAYVEPTQGNPKLKIVDYYNQGTLTLEVGTYNTIVPTSGGNPLFMRGSVGESLDGKYEAVTIEGCGEFIRREALYLTPKLIAFDFVAGEFTYRFDFPDQVIGSRYLKSNGECADRKNMTIRLGGEGGHTYEYPGFPIFTDDDGTKYTILHVSVGGVTFEEFVDAPFVEAWFYYTAMNEGFSVTRTAADPRVQGEGHHVKQHEEFYKYTSSLITVDHTPQMEALADSLLARYTEPDTSGDLNVYIKGLNPNVKLGVEIANAEFSGARVQKITYDFRAREMAFQVSTIPIRGGLETHKQWTMDQTLESGNWYQARNPSLGKCFEGCALANQDGTIIQTSPGGGGGGGTNTTPTDDDFGSYDCVQGTCQGRQDTNGKFKSEGDCKKSCTPGGYDFKKCVGCKPVDAAKSGQYQSLDECVAAHPKNTWFDGCKYKCASGECGPVESCAGDNCYDNKDDCETARLANGGECPHTDDETEPPIQKDPERAWACPTGGCPSLVKKIYATPEGKLLRIECEELTGITDVLDFYSYAFSGIPGTGFEVEEYRMDLLYSCGRLIDYDYYESESTETINT